MDPDFKVKVETFEGPLDLLLSLIEKKKLHISDVSLASITDEYIGYVRERGEYSIADMADFILVAATLMLIKSLALLPGLSVTPEEQASIEDLERRLRILERMRELSQHVRQRFGATRLFERQIAPSEGVVFAPPVSGSVSQAGMHAAMRRVIASIQTKPKLPEAKVKKVLRLEDAISNLMERITRNIRMSFKDFASGDRMNIIVNFLAVLELVKQGTLAASQEMHFADIQIESRDVSLPRYD